METSNPVFARRGAQGWYQQQGRAPSPQYLENMYNAPSYALRRPSAP